MLDLSVAPYTLTYCVLVGRPGEIRTHNHHILSVAALPLAHQPMIAILRLGFPPNMHVTTQADLNHRHHGITLPIRAPRPRRSDTDSLYTMPHFCVYCCRFAPCHVATSATHPAYHSATMFIPVWYIPPRNIVWCGCRESNPEITTSLALRVCLVAPHPHSSGNGNRTRRMT